MTLQRRVMLFLLASAPLVWALGLAFGLRSANLEINELFDTQQLQLALARSDLPLSDIAGPWILSFLPIAAAYHIAHYLVALLTQGQYAIAALPDPLGTGADYLGLGPHWVSFGFLSQQHAVWTIWIVQFAIILGAHLLAVLLSEQIVRRAGLKLSLAAQAPIAFLMVLYTCFGLWLLAAPAIG